MCGWISISSADKKPAQTNTERHGQTSMYLGITPNIAVQLSVLLSRIREVLVSNLGPETGCPDRFSWVS